MTKQENDDDAASARASAPTDAAPPADAARPAESLRPMQVLRDATGTCHRQVEEAVDWTASFQSYASYRQLLERFATIVRPLEQAIAARLSSDRPPEFDPHVRTRWLEDDLVALAEIIGSASEPQPATLSSGESSDFGYLDSRPAAIGSLYVLEGSSLGGQFLSRQLRDRLQLTPARGGSYFAAYGAATAAHWNAFREWANSQLGDPRSTALAVEAAQLTFARFGKALAG